MPENASAGAAKISKFPSLGPSARYAGREGRILVFAKHLLAGGEKLPEAEAWSLVYVQCSVLYRSQRKNCSIYSSWDVRNFFAV